MVGPFGASALRMVLSTAMLWPIARPWRGPLPRRAAWAVLGYGASLGAVNLFFYLALQRIPLGVAVALDFLGPLTLAVVYSRQRLDLVWMALAGFGVALLFPIGGDVARLDPVGVFFCLCSATAWALYILCGKRAGTILPSGRVAALGLLVAALCVLPFGWAQAGSNLFAPAALPLALVVAFLSGAVASSLEMAAMTRLPTRVFGVLMSLEPAFGTLFGWIVLGERLTPRQDVAILCVVLASAGITFTASRAIAPIDG